MAERRKLSDGGTGIYDLVVLRNTGKKMVTLRHKDMGDVDLAPGKQRTVPVGIALVNLGNPGARDSGRSRDRQMEVHRVQRKWGYNRGFFTESAWFEVGEDTTTGVKVGPFCPTIEAFSLDGERMFFVHDDPLGVKNTRDLSRLEDSAQDDRFVRMEMDELRAQMTRLQDLLTSKQEGDKDNFDFVATEDIPDAALEALGITREQMSQALAVAAGVTEDEDESNESDDGTANAGTVVGTADNAAGEGRVVGGQSTTQPTATTQTQADRNELRADELPQPAVTEPPLSKDKPATPRVGGGHSKSK